MNIYLLNLLRFVHVVAGILWAGAAISYLFFVKPSVKSIGAVGPQFMQNLMERRKYPIFMVSTSLLTVLAGGILFWNSSGGFNLYWLQTGPGIGFTIGSVAALIAFLAGNLGIGPTSGKMARWGSKLPQPVFRQHPSRLQKCRLWRRSSPAQKTWTSSCWSSPC